MGGRGYDNGSCRHNKWEYDNGSWDEYFEKIVVCGCSVCHEKKQFKWGIVQIHYINDELPMGNMPHTIDWNSLGIVLRNFTLWYK